MKKWVVNTWTGVRSQEQYLLLCRILDSHTGGHIEFYLLGYNGVESIESQPTYRRNTSQNIALFVTCFHAYSTLKMEAIYSSETLVDFHRTTRRYML
jgi:hypothetical protein